MSHAEDTDYRCFFELGSESALLIAAKDLSVVDVNPAACRLLQRRREDLVATELKEFLYEADSSLEKLLRRLPNGEVEDELRLLRRGGVAFTARVHARAYSTSKGECRICLVLRDVSENQSDAPASLAGEEVIRDTLDYAAVGIAHVSPTGRWLRVNRKLCDILGYSAEELTGMTFREVTHSDDLDTDNENFHQMIMGKIDTYVTEKRYIRKDHTHVWVRLTTRLIRDDAQKPRYFVSIIEDITERKQSETLLSTLTPREVDILRLLARGHTNKDIADELTYSVSTIKAYVRRIIFKLGVSDRTQAAVRAVELGLIRSISKSDASRVEQPGRR